MEDFDFVVIGGGSGGVRAARVAAGLGAKVALVEASRLGGTCVNVGCVPKKLMVYGASFAERFHEARGFGWSFDATPRFDWASLVEAREREICRLNDIYAKLLLDAGVTSVSGFGVFEEARVVRVGDRRLRGEHVLIATGGRSRALPIPGAEHSGSSDDFFKLRELPARVVVAGGGYIGVELASIFRTLGSDVHVVHRNPELLNAFDHDVRRFFAEQLEIHGVQLHLGRTIVRLDRAADGIVATLDDGSRLAADLQLAAVGRVPNTDMLGLGQVGIDTGADGTVLVDDTFATSQPNVWAIGDCIGRVQLTPVALAEGMALARRLFGGQPDASVDYDLVPTAVFASPEVATVGITEEAAWHRGEQVKVFRSTFRPMKHTLSGQPYRMMMKLIVCAKTDRVLGVHVVGSDAGEIVQGFAVALRAGATKAQLDATIGIHPTAAEELVTMRTPVPAMHA